MPEFTAAMESQAPAPAALADPEVLQFTVLSQKLELEIDFPTRSLTGTTVLEIQPWTKDLKIIKINARQCEIAVEKVTVGGQPCKVDWEDSYNRINVPHFVDWSADNWVDQKDKIQELIQNTLEPELSIYLPKGFAIKEANAEQLGDLSNTAGIGPALAANSALASKSDTEYLPIHVSIPFSVKNFREGLHFVGLEDDDLKYPHVYTQQSPTHPGISRCIFPCFDNPKVKPLWTISIKCGRTLGDALIHPPSRSSSTEKPAEIDEVGLDTESKLLEMTVVCSGDVIKDVIDSGDSTKKIVTFEVAGNMVWAGHIAFAIGPFEYVNLSEHRGNEEDRLGQKAVKVNGYCLPGRSDEVNNAAQPIAQAIDHFCMTYGAYPFTDYTVCFVADQIQDTVDSASLTLCSDRLLHPEEIIDELLPVSRKLIHALARQYVGVSLLAETPKDMWLVVGCAVFITESFIKILCGNNEHQFDMKKRTDRLLALDVGRPPLITLGLILHLGPSELEFLELKAPLVLHILDRRLAKQSGSTGLTRVISKMFTAASTGASKDDGRTLTTDNFQKVCEKLSHIKLTEFFKQWVHNSGYPRFVITQKFDKKNLRIKMNIKQTQGLDLSIQDQKRQKSQFAREVKEEANEIWPNDVLHTFTGPMTIRIHEADGTPYEHIIEIDSREKAIEIPYKTKYKRLKRNRRQKERENATARGDLNGPDDILLYCLGDVLQSDQDIEAWKLTDWDQATLKKMDDESFEWISVDSDHEWRISQIDHVMEPYMFASQLQQDRDVVAHINAIKYMAKHPPSPVISSILARTVMDSRYFHGVRTMAAETLAVHATAATDWIGKFHLEKAFQTLFCYPNTRWTPLPNDFEDWQAYQVQNAIATAMANIRDDEGNCPLECRTFIYDQLRLNDNSDNTFSDSYYVAHLIKALADSMIPRKVAEGTVGFADHVSDGEKEELQLFKRNALEEIERYQKIDKTMGSWKNVYTRAALESRKILMEAKIIPSDHREFLAYIHDETLDLVQIDAMAAVVNMGMLFKSGNLTPLFVNIMTTAASPFVRDQLVQIFWYGLASLAFGEHLKKETDTVDDGLVVFEEQEQSDARATQIARTTSIEAALAALKKDVQNDQVLKTTLWEAVKSPFIGLDEQMTLLEYCSILYDPVHAFPVTMTYPRYWKVKNLGKVIEQISIYPHRRLTFDSNSSQGRVAFSRTTKVRTKMRTDASLPVPAPSMLVVHALAPPSKKLKVALNNGEMRAPAKPSVSKPPATSRPSIATASKRAESVSSSSTTASHFQSMAGHSQKDKPSKIVIFRVANKNALRQLLVSKKRKASEDITSPEPLTSPLRTKSLKLKLVNRPDASRSTGESRTPTPGGMNSTPAPPVEAKAPLPDSSGKERKPLPDARKPLPDGPPKKAKRKLSSENIADAPPTKRKGMITLKLGRNLVKEEE